MNSTILILVVVCIGSGFARRMCTDCPKGTSPCHELVNMSKGNCTCSVCITKCSVYGDTCDEGEECIEVPWEVSGKLMVARCDPFTQCKEQTCEDTCSASGYVYDVNGCNTCACEDPCKERISKGECPTGCYLWSTSPYLAVNAECTE